MLLALDVGNSNTVFCLFAPATGAEPAHMVADWRVTTPHKQTADELGVLFQALFSMRGLTPEIVTGIAVSSVVPPLDAAIRSLCETFFHIRPLFIEPGVKTGLPVLTDNPSEAGADRIVNCVAAFDRLGGPTIVVDMGTATTFDVVSAEAEYLGGALMTGIEISLEALSERGARLPKIDLAPPKSVIGKNTVDAIRSGVVFGYAGAVDAILRRLYDELGERTAVIATGGLARLVVPYTEEIEEVDDLLTLTGLRLLHERNS